ncbi:MAG: DoxX family protein [Chitinophagaceae bacterium]|nr:MAG: DoxX family protein [Chitinophagaceae bacterium]
MNTPSRFEQFYIKIKGNRWYWYFSIFCRLTLAAAFIAAGIVKIAGERFASGLSEKHPMGAYLVALQQTGFYYSLIGYAQILAAVLLLIPRAVTLGALLYFPIIVNIWLLSLSVRFEGSFVTSPLMVLANLFILVWNYDRLKYVLPFKRSPGFGILPKPVKYDNKFPFLFFAGVFSAGLIIIAISLFGYEAMPRNSAADCKQQFVNTARKEAGCQFCDCIHVEGKPLNACLEQFEKALKK